jgi:hypothetical protein
MAMHTNQRFLLRWQRNQVQLDLGHEDEGTFAADDEFAEVEGVDKWAGGRVDRRRVRFEIGNWKLEIGKIPPRDEKVLCLKEDPKRSLCCAGE